MSVSENPHTLTGGGAPRQAVAAVPSQAAFVRMLRRFTGDLLSRWQIDEEYWDSAVLIVDELAVNAVQHGRSDMTLFLALDDGMLRIAVADTGAQVAHADSDVDPDEHGP
ncbi:ATP-binding protein [Streptomyces sp. NPDC000880]